MAVPPSLEGDRRGLILGSVPDRTDPATQAHLERISAVLTEAVGVPVGSYAATSPSTLAWAFAHGKVDIAWVSPTLLSTSPALADSVPLVVSVRQGVTIYHGALFVKADSPIRSPFDLQGTRAAWVAPTSAGGYIFPRLALASHGLDPRTLFASETFHDSHGNVARAVLDGEADVGATYAVFEGGIATGRLVRSGFGADGSARILFTTPPIPADAIVAHQNVPAALRATFTRALLQITDEDQAGGAIRHVMGADAFEPVRRGALDSLRTQIHDGHMLGLLGA